jgi:short-subunit dehydrogenase
MEQKNTNRYENKWVLVTGASRGIGRLAALAMAKQGYNVIVHSSTPEHSEQTAQAVKELGVQAKTVAADLSKRDEITAMLKEIDSFGVDVDVVLNNAGAQVQSYDDFCATPIEDYELMFRINTVAPIMICYHFLPKMLQKGFGRIVNTSSGIADQPQQGPYSVSKAALDKFTKDVAVSLKGTDVVISLTDPGWCHTDLGGKNAPNAPETAIPGVIVGAFADEKINGKFFPAQEVTGLSLEDAVNRLQQFIN